jgi:hypothetical protein
MFALLHKHFSLKLETFTTTYFDFRLARGEKHTTPLEFVKKDFEMH